MHGDVVFYLHESRKSNLSIRIQIEQNETRVAARLYGSGLVGEVTQFYPQMLAACEQAGAKKLLLDLARVRVVLSLQDRYELGNRAGIFARSSIKVAVVAAPGQLDPERFGLVVAKNRGVNALVFTDEAEAEAWLEKD